MLNIRNVLHIEMEPTVQEVCGVISAVTAFYPGKEHEVLQGIITASQKRLDELNEKDRPKAVSEIAKGLGDIVANGKRTIPESDPQLPVQVE